MADKKRKFQYSIPEMTKRLFHIAAPVKGLFTVSTVASVLGNLSQMGIMGFGALTLLRLGGILTAGSPVLWGCLTGLFALLIVLCRYTEGYVSHGGAYSLLAHMRISLFITLRRLAPACLMDREKGDLLNIAVSDIETVEFFFAHTIGPMFTVILLPLITLVLAFIISPLYALVLLPIYLVISIIFPLVSVRIGRPIGLRYRTALGKLKSLVLESVYGLRDIQIYDFGEERFEQVSGTNRAVNRAAHGLTIHRQTVTSAPAFFVYLARIAVIAAAAYLAAKGETHPVGTVLLSFVAAASFSSTQSLTTVVSSLLETYAAAERLFLLEDTVPEVQEAEAPVSCGKIESIRFENVDFYYTDPARQILKGFNLSLKDSEKLGIVGESGIGKSTVLRLLLRFWNTRGGRILINGIPIEQISLEELRRRIAVLEQDTFLFDGSIAENIAFGKPEASREEIVAAAKRAGLHDFISTLPEGYETQMGKMSARLSGGEKQRVGIARTLLTDPDVIVMDEPTSSLDVLHEKELLRTLEREYRDKMLIIVSHRHSTLTGCGRIVRLEGGKASDII